MSLERIQASTNRQRVDAGNLSASNDPSQWAHDGREQLIKGAELAAAGRTLGMSEETLLCLGSIVAKLVPMTASSQRYPHEMTQRSTREQAGAGYAFGSDTPWAVFGMTDTKWGERP